jgi:hypothetical protein
MKLLDEIASYSRFYGPSKAHRSPELARVSSIEVGSPPCAPTRERHQGYQLHATSSANTNTGVQLPSVSGASCCMCILHSDVKHAGALSAT